MIKSLKNKKKKGFTLIELIIVIAIIAILTAIAVPKFGQIQKNSKIKADIATAKNIHSVATQYLAEHEGAVPADAALQTEVADKIDGAETVGSSKVLPKSKLDTSNRFTVAISDSNVTVSVNGHQVYPQATDAWKTN